MSRQQILEEIDREIAMRRKVWKARKGPNGYFFTDPKHQRQYDRLVFAAFVFDFMTDAEYETITERISANEKAGPAQQKLF